MSNARRFVAPCASSRVNLTIFNTYIGDDNANDAQIYASGRKGNQAFKDGSLGKTLEALMSKLKPEAAYFAPLDGKRSGMIFFDLADPSQLVEFGEPLFLNLNAEVEIVPVMNEDDLRKGLQKASQQ